MVSVFFAIANNLMNAGFQQALIRKKDASMEDYSTMFYTNIALGFLAYILLFISAPMIAVFYGQMRLVLILRIVGLVVIVNSFQIIQIVDLTRHIDFKTQFKVTVPSGVISGAVAVFMAMNGMGVWSLVAQMTLSPVIITLSLWKLNGWRPSKVFSVESFRELFGFGSKLFLSGMLDILFRNLYVMVIARFFSASVTGYYFFATKVRDILLEQFAGSIQKVTYPVLASIQDDPVRLKSGYRKVIKAIVYLIFPCMMFLAVLAEPLFTVLLNPKWLPAVPYLQLLCMAGLIYPLHVVNLNILQVKGRSDLFLYLEIIKKIMITVVVFFSLQYGVVALLLGQIVTSVLAYVPNSYFSARLIGYPMREQLRDVLPVLCLAGLSSGGMLTVRWLLFEGNMEVLSLIVQCSVGVILYLFMAWCFKVEIQAMLFSMLRFKISKKD
jgi:O-antigen/teichoic acid export membrane protein